MKQRLRKKKSSRVIGDWGKLFDKMTEEEKREAMLLIFVKIQSRS